MTEIHFVIEEALEGGYIARAVGADINNEAVNLPMLRERLRDAGLCHFDDGNRPALIRLHISREEAITA